jgi:hypothetical protein
MLFEVKTKEGTFLIKANFTDGTGKVVGKNRTDCTATELMVAGDLLQISPSK